MKHALPLMTLIIGPLLAGCADTDIGMATQAGIKAVKAVTLDDEDLQRLAAAVSGQYDRQHTVAPPDNPYAERLQRLTAPCAEYAGHTFDFKVYLSPKVSAFAMADGTIRIYSGLMDRMNGEELLFVVGHEMGHVVDDHIKKKIRLAYAGSAVRKALWPFGRDEEQARQAATLSRNGSGGLIT